MAYSTSGVLPVDDLPAGTALLVSGPPLTRKRELMIRLLGCDPDDETIMVTAKVGAGKLRALFREWSGGVFVVDSPTDRERPILSQLIDGIVETRATEAGCELRLRGLGGRAAGWQSYRSVPPADSASSPTSARVSSDGAAAPSNVTATPVNSSRGKWSLMALSKRRTTTLVSP